MRLLTTSGSAPLAPAYSVKSRTLTPISRNFTIWLSPYTAPLRDVFTFAHELGHYFLHSKIGLHPITVNREGCNLVEWEANAFAAAFLLPAEEFGESWEKHRHSVADVAAEFGVSTSMVRIRAELLGLPA